MNYRELFQRLDDWIRKFQAYPFTTTFSREILYVWEDSLMELLAHFESAPELEGTSVEEELKEAIRIAKDHHHELLPDIFRHLLAVKTYLERLHPGEQQPTT